MILNARPANGALSSAGRRLRSSLCGTCALQRRNIQRRRQIIDDRVEQRLHALVLERRAAHHRNELERRRALADAALELVDAAAPCRRDRLRAALRLLPPPSRRDGCAVPWPCPPVRPEYRPRRTSAPSCSSCQMNAFIRHEIDHALNSASAPIGQVMTIGRAPRRSIIICNAARKIGAHAVHLVDEADARHAIFVGLAPHGFGLRLDARDGVEHGDRAVEHAHRTLDLDGEVDMAGRVDDVDAVLAPDSRWWQRK